MTRRELLRFLSTIGVSPAVLIACAGQDGEDFDAGNDAGSETGGDAGSDVFDGSDVSELNDTTPEPTEDEAHPDVEAPPEYEYDGPTGPDTLFSHGVASGDPLPDAVILWTRVSPDTEGTVDVWWEIAADPDFTRRIAAGTKTTGPDRDYTVKHDVTGLYPGNTYYYRFFSLGVQSIVGRTRTAPRYGGRHLRLAVVSCSNYPNGYFHVYRAIAEQPDLDAVLHLGDYIYEYGGGAPPRQHFPNKEIISISDYRGRYAQYRSDPDLQAVHQQHPFVVVWDDHETANNSWEDGAQNHNPGEGLWVDRKAAGIKAWFEWMPARENPEQKIWRTFRFGKLLDLIMLDTRLWGRDQEVAPADVDAINDPERTLLGEDQEAWLAEELRTSTTAWRVIGQQVMMGHFKLGDAVLNADQWDGYAASRDRFLDVIEDDAIDNVVVLTGDIHTSWAMDITRQPSSLGGYDAETGEGSLAVEFVTPSVTSSGLSGVGAGVIDIIVENNPHMRWVDLSNKGYVLVDITEERIQGAWFFVSDVRQPNFTESFARAYSTQNGANHLVEDLDPAAPKSDAPPLAPGIVER